MDKSVSMVMAALNEEKNVRAAVESAIQLLEEHCPDYELLVFNDGSTDRTGAIIDQLAKSNPRIRVTQYSVNRGLSASTKDAIKIATKNYLTWFPGDHSIDKDSMVPILTKIGQADIIVSYMGNPESRPFLRQIVSETFVWLMNAIFHFRLRYYNGPTVYPVRLLKSLTLKSNGYEFYSEILIRALRTGATYIEVPFTHKPDPQSRSKAFTLKNFISVVKTTGGLIKDIYFSNKK